jgi:error-prone DNA polymerase
MAFLRQRLSAAGIVPTRDLATLPDGATVRVAGHVIVRQRPGTAKGFCFLTLEDETGTANAIVTPRMYERYRIVLNTSPLLEVVGKLQRREGVTHVRAAHLARVEPPGPLPAGHDYH